MLSNSMISIGFSTYISYVLIVPGGALVSALALYYVGSGFKSSGGQSGL